jgi:glutamate-ammonia-ligase adenylyltransferase
VIDELASDAILKERFVAADFEHELAMRLAALQSTGEDDDETLLNLLRRAHHAEVFRTLARDIEGRITVEQVADDLSALADSVLRITAQWCWSRLKSRHRDTPRFGIVGYGKLGGKELGYGSDLDIVFVFDDDDDRAPEVYAAYVRKLINWLTVKTGEGDLFEIDTALRPNGNSGLLVTSFESYANYQQQRGSNTAWTWEHQAMTRARFVLGSRDFPRRQASLRPICTCISALMRCAKPSSPRRAMPRRCATRLKPCVSGCAAPIRYAAACLMSSTAPAAWWMWNLPCSTWCWPNPVHTAS